MKLLVLYEELAGYVMASLRAFADADGAEILIVHKPVNAVAPFVLDGHPRIRRVEHRNPALATLRATAHAFAPDAILCGGWSTPAYLRLCREYRNTVPTILAFDTWWFGDLRQRLKWLVGRATLSRWFSACFVPGQRQALLAHKLGFADRDVRLGFYTCDQPLFRAFGREARAHRGDVIPKRFLYVGRYAEEKGVRLLWRAFDEIRHESTSTSTTPWELWCAGIGPEQPPPITGIRHLGFVQPAMMKDLVRDCGVFVLPSDFEPWGVALHEFAAAGLPLIASDRVGAGEQFLRQGENGFVFRHHDLASLKTAMRAMMAQPDHVLTRFAERSTALGATLTPARWATTLTEMIRSPRP